MLTLWQVTIPIPNDIKDQIPIVLNRVIDKTRLSPEKDISDVFISTPLKKTIHIVVQRQFPIHTAIPARASTPLAGHLSDDSRPGTPLSGDLRIDIKKITDRFFEPGTRINFFDSFIKGEGGLPITTGPIRGLPRAWRWSFGQPNKTRPSLLFLDLPDPSTPDISSKNLASTSILHMVKENNRPLIPMFGVSGCGKTRAVIELLSRHWGFYFNASSDDWGSGLVQDST